MLKTNVSKQSYFTIKNSLNSDPKQNHLENLIQKDNNDDRVYTKKAQISKPAVTQVKLTRSNKQPSPPTIQNKKPPISSKKATLEQKDEIKISWTEQQARFDRYFELNEELAKVIEQNQIYEKKVTQLEAIVTQLQRNIFVQKQKNHQLSKKIDAISHQNVAADQFYEMQQSYIKMQGMVNQFKIENHELLYQVQELRQKEILYQKLLIEYNSTKLRCENFEANNQKYKGQIARMKKSLRDFENQFYSASKKPNTKKEQKQFQISLTEKKLEFIQQKVHEFQNNFVKLQLQTFEKMKDDATKKYEQHLKNDIERIMQNAVYLFPTQRDQQIEKVIKKNQIQLKLELQQIEKNIDQHSKKLNQIQLGREKKTLRERVQEMESKMIQLNHSQIIKTLSLSMKESSSTTQLKNKQQIKQTQNNSPKKSVLLNPVKSYVSSDSKNSQKLTIQVNEPNAGLAPKNLVSVVKSPMNSMLAPEIVKNSAFVSQIAKINTKFSTVNQSLINQTSSNGARFEYDDGTLVPSLPQFQYLQHEIKVLKVNVAALEDQLKDIRNEFQKANTKNQQLYQEAREVRVKLEKTQIENQKLKANYQNSISQLQNSFETKIKSLHSDIQILKQQNAQLSLFIQKFQSDMLKNKKNRQELVNEIDGLKKQIVLKQANFKTKISEITFELAQKRTGKHGIDAQEEIHRKDMLLEKQLEENLNLTNKVEQQEIKIQQLEDLIAELSSIVSEKCNHVESMKTDIQQLTSKLQKMTQQLIQKDKRIKKAEENLSVQMSERRSEIVELKKENKKLEVRIDLLKEKHEDQIRKRDKKYQKLEQKLIGIEEANQSLKESLKLSRSFSLKGSLSLKEQGQNSDKESLILRRFDSIKQNNSLELSIL